MNPSHLHLISTHLPVLGSLFGLLLLLLSLGQRNEALQRTSLWFLVLAGLCAVPTYLSGRPASVALMKLVPSTSMDAGDQHAEVAILALSVALVLATVALVGLTVFRKRKLPAAFLGLILALGLLSTGAMTWTAFLGGRIRHTEILDKTAIGQASARD